MHYVVYERTNYLAEGQVAALDRAAEAEGVSRAELIHELIDRAIGGHPGADLTADLAAIDASFGILAEQVARRAATLLQQYRRSRSGILLNPTGQPRSRRPPRRRTAYPMTR
jgi:hypothetical protein